MDQPAIAATAEVLAFRDALAPENKNKLILAVDDDSETLATLASIGRRAGYTMFVTTSGAECLSMLSQVTPHLIMLDVKMPGLDGFETCRRIRSDPKVAEVPVAFLTARRTVEDFKRGMAVGCDDFVIKPFNAVQLLSRIQFLISRGHSPIARGVSQRPPRRRGVLVALDPRIGTQSEPGSAPEAGPSPMVTRITVRDVKSTDIEADPPSDLRAGNSIGADAGRCSLMQVASVPLEPFLVQENTHKAPGLIAISSLPLWWDALMSIADDHLSAMQEDLDGLSRLNDEHRIEAFTETLRVIVASLTGRLVKMAADPQASTPDAVKSLARAVAAIEIKLISEILQAAGPLDREHAAFTRFKLRITGTTSLRIADLSPRFVAEAKRCYLRLGDGDVAAQLFVLAILNHLDKPWQIFRLSRALSWKKDAAAVTHGNLAGMIGDRILFDLDDTALAVNAVTTIAKTAAGAISFGDLAALVARYVDTEGTLLREIESRPDSPWGVALLRSRARMCAALDEDRLQCFADAILAPLQDAADSVRSSDADTRDDAVACNARNDASNAAASIEFLTYVAQRGERRGFGGPARRLLDALRDDIATRIEASLDQQQLAPESAAPEYLTRAAQLVGVLYSKDKRGRVLGGRLKAALKGKK